MGHVCEISAWVDNDGCVPFVLYVECVNEILVHGVEWLCLLTSTGVEVCV